MNQPDGWVIVGTKIDDTQFQEDIKNLKSQLKKYEKEAEELLTTKTEQENKISEIEAEIEAYQKLRNEYDETAKKIDFINRKRKELSEQGIPYNEFPAQYSSAMVETYSKQMTELFGQMAQYRQPQTLQPELEAEKRSLDDVNQKLIENEQHQDEIKQQISERVEKTEAVKQANEEIKQELKEIEETEKNIKSALQKTGKGITSIISKVGHWAIAILGVYSAYSLVRQAMSTLSQYDKTLAADLEYIRFAIATALKPVVEFIVDLIYKLLGYTRYLLKAWFGIDIFANASASAFKRAKESLKSSAKSAKEINKQLAGFDEMNILVDTRQTNTNKDSDFTMPSHDLGKDLGDDAPGWLRWLGKNKDWILPLLAGIVAGLLAMRLGFGELKALGIGVMFAGILIAVKGLLDYLENPTWENFGKIIQGIGIFVIGLGIAFLGLPGIIAGVVILIFGTIVKYWEKIKEFLQGGIDWLVGKSDWIHEHFGDFIGGLYDILVGKLQTILNKIDKFMNNLKGYFDDLIAFINNIFAGNWEGAWENIKNIFMNRMGDILKIINYLSKPGTGIFSLFGIGGISIPIPFAKSKKSAKGSIIYQNKLPKLALGGIVNQPGRGVPYNGAIIGEKGAEAVIPLTDSQQMELLGQTIGKYITINANITNTMNGRIISRELQKVQNDNDFAYNR